MVSTFYKLYLGGNQGGDPQLYFRLSSLFRQVRSIQTTLCGDPTLIGAARPPGGYSYGGYSHETCRHRIKWVLSVPTSKRALWVKARPDYEPLFSILDGLRQDADRRFWIERVEAREDNCDIEVDTGQVSVGVEIMLQMSDKTLSCNTLTRAEEYT